MLNAGLILEGGGMRGAYTAGVLDCLIDNKIYFKNVYGVSAGSCHACSYLSQQKERAIHTITDYLDDKNYASFYSLVKTGDFFGAKMVYDDIPNKLIPFDYQTFIDSPMNLYAILTNCRTGKAEYHLLKDLYVDTIKIRASSSLPLLSKMVSIDNELYLDGGISDSIPLEFSQVQGNKKNVIVLTQHSGYKKKPNRLTSIMKLFYKKYPLLINAIKTRHLKYNDTLELIEKGKKDNTVFVIQPKNPVKIGRLEKDTAKLWDLYKEGYYDMLDNLDKMIEFIKE
ncbi:putative patatin/cPLA2 family phospholipase [Bacilli bacterium PM5-3]|nr:putative patatin/cPLA2 family phospholipase [Bacilli bacterium PM5-3]MDH6603123.1 putative patatin/cPLA2 family phospholipase [Bacilli bacterium PM5-9]